MHLLHILCEISLHIRHSPLVLLLLLPQCILIASSLALQQPLLLAQQLLSPLLEGIVHLFVHFAQFHNLGVQLLYSSSLLHHLAQHFFMLPLHSFQSLNSSALTRHFCIMQFSHFLLQHSHSALRLCQLIA